VQWPTEYVDPTVEEVIEKINASLESPEINLYDDIGYLALNSLERSYLGMFQPVFDQADNEKKYFSNFLGSPFYQSMKNDLRGTAQLTTNQYKKAVERVITMCNNITMDMGAYENIMSILEDYSLDNEYLRSLQKKKQQQKSPGNLFTEDIYSPGTAKSTKGQVNNHSHQRSCNTTMILQ
jgi:hypothetical protein